jgi:hypothetical protein
LNLKQSSKSYETKNDILTREKLWAVLCEAAREGSANIIDFIFSSLKATGKSDTINKLLLQKDKFVKSAWHEAANFNQVKTLDALWGWGRKVKVNFKDELLLAKVRFGLTAWDIAAEHSNKEILEKLWSWGREVQVNLKDELLLPKEMMD